LRTVAGAIPAADVSAADIRHFSDRASRSEARVDQSPTSAADVALVLAAPDTTTSVPAPAVIAALPKSPPPTSPRPAHHPTTTTTSPRPRPTTTTAASPPPAPAHSETGGASWYRTAAGTCANNDAPMGTGVDVTD